MSNLNYNEPSAGTGVKAVATETISAVEYQKVKLADGTAAATGTISAATAANQGATASTNALAVAQPGQWAATSAPAAGTLASASKAAGSAGVRHVCTGLSVSWASDGTANGAAQQITVVLRDGAAGAGTILAQWTFQRTTTTATDAANAGSFSLHGLNIIGTAATAMTLEFSSTVATHELYTANLFGYDCV